MPAWLERAGVALLGALVVAVPTAFHGWPATVHGNAFVALLLAAGVALAWWRTQPRAASALSLGLLLVAASLGGWFPDPAIVIFSFSFAVLALAWPGRAAWLAALCGVGYVVVFYDAAHVDSWVAAVVITLPTYAAGTALRLRRDTADLLARRAQEVEEERELVAEIAVRHERGRIAGELHDIVGHAVSVMVIQAAAGQRLVDTDPDAAREAFAAISESARQGTRDLDRLVELLGAPQDDGDTVDLSLVDEVVARAGRSGLDVTCRFEGDRGHVVSPVAHLAFRVVQESLTNAMRYAPGSGVRIVIRVDQAGRDVTVRVENDGGTRAVVPLTGTGRGLLGLRERVQRLGGQFSAGADGTGGWLVVARLPGR